MNITSIFITIVLIFILLLAAKKITGLRFCIICGAVSATWIALLILYWAGKFHDGILLALLMGGSAVGIFYLVQHYVPEPLQLFRLPFLLTIFAIFYSAITPSRTILPAVVLLAGLWGAAVLLYIFRTNPYFSRFVKTLLECCRRW